MEPEKSGKKNITEQTRTSVAEHIAVEASRLSRMARLNEFTLLTYLIDMAVLEAWREAGEAEPGAAILEDSR